MGRGQPGDGNPIRGTGDVIEADPVEERDGRWITAVLSADPQLEVVPGLAAPVAGELNELAHTPFVERLEGVGGQDVGLEVPGHELPLDVVPGEAERGLGQVVRSE